MQVELDRGPVAIHGRPRSAGPPVLRRPARGPRRARRGRIALVAADDITALEPVHNLGSFFLGDPAAETSIRIAVLPGIDVSPYAELSPDRTAIVERIATLYRLMIPELRPRVVVTSAEARLPAARSILLLPSSRGPRPHDRGRHHARSRRARRAARRRRLGARARRRGSGDVRDPRRRHRCLLAARAPPRAHRVIRRRSRDLAHVRRGVAAHADAPIDLVHLHPVRETIATGTSDVRTRLRAYAEEIGFPSKATRKVIEQLEAGGVFVGIENLTPAFHDVMVSPADAMPARHARAGSSWDLDARRRAVADAVRPMRDAQFAKRHASSATSRIRPSATSCRPPSSRRSSRRAGSSCRTSRSSRLRARARPRRRRPMISARC